MRKMSQITTASSKISILALLFIVTAAPHIRDYSGTKLHQKNLESEKGVASGNLDHFPVAPKTNKLGQASRKSSDAVVPTTESLRQAQRNTHDGIAVSRDQHDGDEIINTNGVSESNPFALTERQPQSIPTTLPTNSLKKSNQEGFAGVGDIPTAGPGIQPLTDKHEQDVQSFSISKPHY